jgi:hypothetical protein
VSHRISDFLIQIIVLAACLQKTGGFARNRPLARATFAFVWLSHPYYQRIFQIKYPRAVGSMHRGCELANAKLNNIITVQSRQFFKKVKKMKTP